MNTFRMVTELWWPASCWLRVDVTSGIAVATTAAMTGSVAPVTGTIAAGMELPRRGLLATGSEGLGLGKKLIDGESRYAR
jgi:hypothetical protein